MKLVVLAIAFGLALVIHTAHGQQAGPSDSVATERTALEADKLEAEVAKLRAEVDTLNSLGPFSRIATAWIAAVGTLIGGLITLTVAWMGHRLAAGQSERTRREATLSLQRLIQEREVEREQHNFRLFEALRNESLAAATVLLDRLRHLHERLRATASPARQDGDPADPSDDERLLVKKVLLNVLKMDALAPSPPADERAVAAQASRDPAAPSYLRKYIAEEMVDILGVKFPSKRRPTEAGTSPLGERREFQRCDLRDVYWANVDARGLDFYGCDLSGASLREAALRGSVFYEALMAEVVLRDADLRGANLMGADLRNGNLAGASLQGANLTDANLDGVRLDGAIYNTEQVGEFGPTQWPSPTFDPTALGARIDNAT